MKLISPLLTLLLTVLNNGVDAEQSLRGFQASGRQDKGDTDEIGATTKKEDYTNTGRDHRALATGDNCYGEYDYDGNIAVSGTGDTIFTKTSGAHRYNGSGVKFHGPKTEFTIGGNEVSRHKRIILTNVYPTGSSMPRDTLAEIGLFPSGRVWSPYHSPYRLNSYAVGDKFKFQIDTSADVIRLLKNGSDTGTTFPANGATQFIVSIWFYESSGSVGLTCPPPPTQVPTKAPTPSPTPSPTMTPHPSHTMTEHPSSACCEN